MQNMATCVESRSGGCWLGNFDGQKLGELLGVPVSWENFTILPFGYPDPAAPPQAKPSNRAPRLLITVAYYERFGESYTGTRMAIQRPRPCSLVARRDE